MNVQTQTTDIAQAAAGLATQCWSSPSGPITTSTKTKAKAQAYLFIDIDTVTDLASSNSKIKISYIHIVYNNYNSHRLKLLVVFFIVNVIA